MPRKPTSVYVILEMPNQSFTPIEGLAPTDLMAWRVPLNQGQGPEDVADAVYAAHPQAGKLTLIEDNKVTAYQPDTKLVEIDDPRLPDE